MKLDRDEIKFERLVFTVRRLSLENLGDSALDYAEWMPEIKTGDVVFVLRHCEGCVKYR